jgi:hypothetical protein
MSDAISLPDDSPETLVHLCRDVKIDLSDHGAFTCDWGHLENRT